MSKSYVIVGVSGTTNSGKTSIVEKLRQYFPGSQSMCQDDYFHLPGDERLEIVPGRDHANWEKLSAMDMDRMQEDVTNWINEQKAHKDDSTRILFIEGILIFNYIPFTKLFDKKYFLEVDKNTCMERRRVYDPPDPHWYFDEIVWPMYLKNLEELKTQDDICYMSGTGDQEKNVSAIKQTVLSLLNEDTNERACCNGFAEQGNDTS